MWKPLEWYCPKGCRQACRNKLQPWRFEESLTPRLRNLDDSTEPFEEVELSRCCKLEDGEQIVNVQGRLKASIEYHAHLAKVILPIPWLIFIVDSHHIHKCPIEVLHHAITLWMVSSPCLLNVEHLQTSFNN